MVSNEALRLFCPASDTIISVRYELAKFKQPAGIDAFVQKWLAKQEKRNQFGWKHSMCLPCSGSGGREASISHGRYLPVSGSGKFVVSACRNIRTESAKSAIR